MRIRAWGTRGSIPSPGPCTQHYGGNTSCYEIRVGDTLLIIDAGTGIRQLGIALMEEFQGKPIQAHMLITHTHWDHIQGFPFFEPAYEKQNRFLIYGNSSVGKSLSEIFKRQMRYEFFPVHLDDMAAKLVFKEIREEAINFPGVRVTHTYMNHPGICLGFRLESGGKVCVYMTDNEPYITTLTYMRKVKKGEALSYIRALDDQFVKFAHGADLLICDGMYTREEYERKRNWGHSCIDHAVEIGMKAGVRRLAIHHHDPTHSDDLVDEMIAGARKSLKEAGSQVDCFGAKEGMIIEL